jgi:hypothetical protein
MDKKENVWSAISDIVDTMINALKRITALEARAHGSDRALYGEVSSQRRSTEVYGLSCASKLRGLNHGW